jgi:hypothetical protein
MWYDCLTKIISVWAMNISFRVIAVAEKGRVPIHTFSKELRGNFSALNSIWSLAINPTARLFDENYFSLGSEHLVSGNSSCRKKKGFYSSVFKGVERKLFFLKFSLEVGHQSYCTIVLRKLILVWAMNIWFRVIAVAEKRRVAIYPFSKELRGNFSA